MICGENKGNFWRTWKYQREVLGTAACKQLEDDVYRKHLCGSSTDCKYLSCIVFFLQKTGNSE